VAQSIFRSAFLAEHATTQINRCRFLASCNGCSQAPTLEKTLLDPKQIRDRFRCHLGDERYAKFVMRVPDSTDGTRLFFWQERAWEDFVAAHPDCALDHEQLVDVLADCPEYGARIRKQNYLKLVETWLRGAALSVDDLESKHILLGIQNERCAKLKSAMQDGDMLREFRSPPETWAIRAGQQGIALVRDGHVVEVIVTRLN
jgi:hypothetical protein